MADTSAVNPGNGRRLERYWTRGPGLARWAESPKPWTTLVALLTEHVNPELAKRLATTYFHKVFGYYPGSDLHRVAGGQPPRGNRIGPG